MTIHIICRGVYLPIVENMWEHLQFDQTCVPRPWLQSDLEQLNGVVCQLFLNPILNRTGFYCSHTVQFSILHSKEAATNGDNQIQSSIPPPKPLSLSSL